MALDLHVLERGAIGRRVLAIEPEMFDLLVPCFRLVQQRTGITVDQYTEVKLPWRTYGAILDAIKELRPTSGRATVAALEKLETALLELDESKYGAIFVGD